LEKLLVSPRVRRGLRRTNKMEVVEGSKMEKGWQRLEGPVILYQSLVHTRMAAILFQEEIPTPLFPLSLPPSPKNLRVNKVSQLKSTEWIKKKLPVIP